MSERSRNGLRVLRGGRAEGGAAVIDEDELDGLVREDELDGLTSTALGELLLRYVLLPQALGDRCTPLLFAVAYRLLGQRDPDAEA